MVRGQADAAVLEVGGEDAGLQGAGHFGLDRIVDGDVNVLGCAGDQDILHISGGQVLVNVHADAHRALFLGRFQATVAGVAAAAEDHIRLLGDHRQADFLALGRIGEGRDVLVERRHLRVDALGAVLVAGDEAHDRRDFHAGDRADDTGFAHAGRQDARQVADLILLEHQAGDVGQPAVGVAVLHGVRADGVVFGREVGVVNDRELDVRILLGLDRRRIAHQEADGDDHVVAFSGKGINVLLVVRRLLGLDVLGLDAQVGHRLLHAGPRRLVERLVVHTTDIGHQTDLQSGGLGFRSLGRFGHRGLGRLSNRGFGRFGNRRLGRLRCGGGGRLGATGRQDHGQDDQQAQDRE